MSKINELIEEFCPEGVPYRYLGRVAAVQKGSQVNKASLSDDLPYPVYNGGINASGNHSEFNYPSDTITVSQGGASAGYVNFVRQPLWVGAHCYSVVPGPEAMNRFLYFIVKSLEPSLQESKYGAGIPALGKNTLTHLLIPVPPLEVQREIVSILDKFTQLEAELEAELESRRVQLRELTELLIDSTESHGQELAFGDLAQILRGSSPRPIENYMSDNPEDLPWVKIGDVSSDSKFVTKTRQRVSAEGASKSRLINPGDFILSNSMSFGRPYISKIRGCIHDGWLMISDFQNSFNPDYLYYLLGSNSVQEQFRAQAGSGTVKNLNAEIVKRIKLRVPPMEMQDRIASVLDSFEELVSDSDCSIPSEITARRKQYEYYRHKLLTFKELERA